jgi:putative tryptophan/tyrosine transport system substrate-binding protein
MRRREFITALGGAAVAWPLAARAQQPAQRPRRLAVLMGGVDDGGWRPLLDAFLQALEQLGWKEGHNISTHIRWGSNNRERIALLARELVALKPDVILAGPSNAVIQVQRETRTIPIVFVTVSDPIGQGIVDSLARPSGNVTGFSNLEFSLIGKWVQILKEIAPAVKRVALMIFIGNAASPNWYRRFDTVAPSFAIEPIAAPIRDRADIERTIQSLAQRPNDGLIVPGDTFVDVPELRRFIIDMTARYGVPALYTRPEFVTEGGLVCYGIDRFDPYRRAASYVDRILKGETPADLPVQQPIKFELIINLKTAKSLGLSVPLTLQASADEVIE